MADEQLKDEIFSNCLKKLLNSLKRNLYNATCYIFLED